MKIPFTKMHGLGNDYIYIDCFATPVETLPDLSTLAACLSLRRFSVGSDGLVLILPSDKATARMRMFNADGSEGLMCGNAIRCVGKYLYERGLISPDTREITVQTAGKHYRLIPVSVGNPHWVCFAEDLSAVDVVSEGAFLSSAPEGGVNVEFVEIVDETTLRMRVYERGSGVTLACGTGACASVAAAVSRGICSPDTPITVLLDGGALTVIHCEGGTTYMLGGAEFAYDGVWEGEI